MNHFKFNPTPISKLYYLSDKLNNNIFIKRDDLLESGGGGSKSRMLQYILYKAVSSKHDCIITAGGPYSNFNRSLALMCGKYNLKMHLVLYDKNTHINKDSLNKKICDYCDVEYIRTSPTNVVETIAKEKKRLEDKGFKPYYIWGGGKSLEGVYAYYNSVKEIKEQLNFVPDYIAVPIGTGTTFTGLVLGCKKYLPKTKVLGISIARKKEQARLVVEELISDFQSFKSDETIKVNSNNLYIIDDYLFGGYGKLSTSGKKFIQDITKKEGIVLDEIYVGKALYGLKRVINEKLFMRDKYILFINTGGIYNF